MRVEGKGRTSYQVTWEVRHKVNGQDGFPESWLSSGAAVCRADNRGGADRGEGREFGLDLVKQDMPAGHPVERSAQAEGLVSLGLSWTLM